MTAPDPDDVSYLVALSDADFAEVVFANLGDEAPAKIWTALCDKRLVWRTSHLLRERATALRDALADSEGATPAELGAAAGLRGLLDCRLRQVRQARKAYAELVRAPREGHNRAVIRALSVGINAHRLACREAALAAEPHDDELWSLLNDLRIAEQPGQPGISLSEMVLGAWADSEAAA